MSHISVRGEQSTTNEITTLTNLFALATSSATEAIRKTGPTTFANVSLAASSGATAALDNLAAVAINTSLLLGVSDGGALGSTSKMWSDLFLASGAVINFNNGNMTITHSAGNLTIAGGTLTIPTSGLIINATTVTTTGVQLNYLNGATGTTGTTSTNLVFSTSPVFITPTLGVASATSLATSAASPLLLTNGQLITIALTAQTTGGATLTIPDFASVSDEFVFKTKSVTMSNKTFVAPVLGAATATSINGLIISTTTGTLTMTNGKTLAVTNTLTLSGTDSTVMTFPTTSATIARTDAGNTFTGASTASAWVLTSPTITTKISPTTDDGAPLGDTTHNFADLFLATGGVINYANGNVTITHSSGLLTFSSPISLGTSNAITVGTIELGAASDTTIARVSAGVVSIEGVNILTVAGGTLTGSITLGENTGIALDPAGSADGKWSGITIAGTAGYAQTYGDLVYLAVADSRWEKTDADAAATGGPVLIGIVVVAGAADGSACTILLQGQIRADAAFPALTVGAPVYVGETAGAVQVAIPTGADNVIRVVGMALTADEIYFNPSMDHQITVA